MAEHDESKLPAWAQRELDTLRNEIERQANANAVLRRDVGETDVFVTGWPDNQPLPRHSHIRFQVGADRFEYIEVRSDGDGSVEVRCGDGGLSVQPRAANVIEVRRLER